MGQGTTAGFTMTELVLVLVLVGILAAFAVPRLNLDSFQQTSYARELTNVFRHAQRVAQASGCHVQVSVNASGYSVSFTGAGGTPCAAGSLPHPTGGGPLQGSGEVASGGSVVFDGMGRTGGVLSITLADGQTITVEPGSGYVH